MIQRMFTATALAASCGMALATLPPPDAAAQAKAAEAAAKSAWQSKVDAYKVCQVQDRIAARYKSNHPQAAAPAGAATGASAPAAGASALQPAPRTAPLAQGGGTPVPEVAAAVKPLPPCADPGPFAYTPASQKPLESSGAHSPPGNATSPPSVNAPSSSMTPSKAGAAPKK